MPLSAHAECLKIFFRYVPKKCMIMKINVPLPVLYYYIWCRVVARKLLSRKFRRTIILLYLNVWVFFALHIGRARGRNNIIVFTPLVCIIYDTTMDLRICTLCYIHDHLAAQVVCESKVDVEPPEVMSYFFQGFQLLRSLMFTWSTILSLVYYHFVSL